MSFIDLAKKRYSCRAYEERQVEREKIVSCVEAARLAPSACNSQPWSFVVVDDKQTAIKLSENLSDGPININKFTKDCRAFIVIVEENANVSAKLGGKYKDQEYAQMDIGIAAMSICLNATDVGLGSCIMGWFNEKNVASLLDIPKGKRIRLIIALGYPKSDEVKEKKRKSLEDIMRINKP